MANDYMTVTQFAGLLNVNPQAIRRMDIAGTLKPALKLPDGTRLYTPEQVDEYFKIKSQELEAKSEKLKSQRDQIKTKIAK